MSLTGNSASAASSMKKEKNIIISGQICKAFFKKKKNFSGLKRKNIAYTG